MNTSDDEQSYAFNADINQLMSLIINTFYSNKDIAIRELISNASDALDKRRHAMLTSESSNNDEDALDIRISVDDDKSTIIIEDSGIGMTQEDLINTLGTIAKSGTKAFMEKLQQNTEGAPVSSNMIGQFGVGFYSAFLIADKVDVVTKHLNDDRAFVWSSNATESFTIRTISQEEFGPRSQGTRILLHVKENAAEYADNKKLTDIVQRHSEFINHPILIKTKKEVKTDDDNVPPAEEEIDLPKEEDDATSPKEEDDATSPKEEDDATSPKEEDDATSPKEEDDATSPKEEDDDSSISEDEYVWQQLNNQKPIWTRDPTTITDEEYSMFYKAIDKNANDDPLARKHFHVEGQLEFKGVLFTPSRAPFDMFQKKTEKTNVRLYVRRVFITDDCKELVPEYLNFVRGVVDSEDIPLNVSREMLQQNNILKVIRKHIVKKSLEMFKDLADKDEEEYLKFYTSFSKNLKLGVHEDSKNRTKLLGLLRYQTSMSEGKMVSLDECLERRKTESSPLYYITGEDVASIKNSPLLEKLFQQGHEVIFMTDTIDEYVVQQVTEYKECKLVSAAKDGMPLDLSEDEKKTMDETSKKLQPLCDAVKTILGNDIEKVVFSKRVVSSPCCLVSGEYGWSANMERIMKAQALGDSNMMSFMGARRTLELNPDSPIVQSLFTKLKFKQSEIEENDDDDTEKNDSENNDVTIEEDCVEKESNNSVPELDPSSIDTIRNAVWLLYDSCSLGSGFNVKDLSKFSERINNIVKTSLE